MADESPVFAAVDLGASSGRVVAGVVERDAVRLHTVHRFPNSPQPLDGHLRWDFTGLYDEILAGLARLAHEYPNVRSVGIDTWGVDYALLDRDCRLLSEPIAYRDDRTRGAVEAVHARVDRAELYRLTGVQFLPFNTIYQLAAESPEALSKAAHVVMLPDLIAFWLTGELQTEATIASTSGLVDVRTSGWSPWLLDRLGLRRELFLPVAQPGSVLGPVRSDICARLGLHPSTVVTTVGSHDTASAVAGVPATSRSFAFVSSGTWSLVGLELDRAILTAEARDANFTNERGVDGRMRFLRNVGGLWLLEQSLRAWAEAGASHDLAAVLVDAAALPDGGLRVDVDDPAFLAPGDMPSRIADAAGRSCLTPPETVRCIVDSLADAIARTVHEAGMLAGVDIDVVHLVGGGAQNDLLCRRTAETTACPVVAGPAEATALGNILVQARTHGAMPRSLDDARARIAKTISLRRFEPSGTDARR